MSLTAADVEKVALLSRLMLSPEELQSLTSEMASIVEYVDQLAEVDTSDVEPMAHAVEMHNVTKDDAVAQSLSREQALATAPKHNNEGYLVPAVLGD
ncbi:Asp-tRNA(Asn)/Glu-tRNA(Gln) amidotransferase subunit GatC [Aeoliella mucimassa]|uniref:Aspartyl/glutamyl-tRNA(Asn/Gln) amidotransferase subunit C n=1 Tax=Aeoliella mucimassa TaxID=2527972 RepID=A0A518ANX6_9BACT|nr:Asp-tRNA(Asn)/Glu-tRNA(Gln) amidotransferase subunit GatC [Aeoliella mucimassa]QDU56428.1 Glutamyl-tRNA(Gln) amidotransferase subunit C [Aeoliella mucimassa]